MRSAAIGCLLLVMVFLPRHACAQQWEKTNGPNSDFVHCLYSSGSMLFEGSGGHGVFRSTDSGKTWTNFQTGLKNLYILSIVSTGNYLFVATGNGVYRS